MIFVTHLKLDDFGDIKEAILNNGEVLNYMEVFDLAREGMISNVYDDEDFFGRPTLKVINQEAYEIRII